MTQELLNLFYAIGIGLTFLSSIGAIVVSVISIQVTKQTARETNRVTEKTAYETNNLTRQTADHTNYLNTITAEREKWSWTFRDHAAQYFTQITRLCSNREKNHLDIYNEFTKAHFMLFMLISEDETDLQNKMNALRATANELVLETEIWHKHSQALSKAISYHETHENSKYEESRDIDKIKSDLEQSASKIYAIKAHIHINEEFIFNYCFYKLSKAWETRQHEASQLHGLLKNELLNT